MRRYLILILVLLSLGGASYALIPMIPNMFPNTTELSRVPTGTGTIGGLIANILGISDLATYNSDGTVENTERFAGVTATGYLTSKICNINEVYREIDANGQPVCGMKTPGATTDLGRIVEGSGAIRVYHASGSYSDVSTYPYTIRNSDIIDTPLGGAATIVFNDDSLLRLDEDTTISLDVGQNAFGQDIASILLENGQFWGRILTMTGSYIIGTNEIVAGVRGTSVNITKTGATNITLTWSGTTHTWLRNITGIPLPTTLHVLDSTIAGAAATVRCNVDGHTLNLNPEQSIVSSGTCPPSATSSPAATTYSDPWINRNTQEDLRYMTTLITLSGSAGDGSIVGGVEKEAKLSTEIINTTPTPSEQTHLCSQEEMWIEGYGCQRRGLLAIADYTRGDTKFYKISNDSQTQEPISPISNDSFTSITTTDYVRNGVSISGSIQYIGYEPTGLGAMIGGWSGKTLEIELVNVLTTGSTRMVLDFGIQNLYLSPSLSFGGNAGDLVDIQSSNIDPSKKILKIKMKDLSSISTLYIGGDNGGSTIRNVIKTIKITNP